MPSTRSKIQKNIYFGFTHAPLKFISAPRKDNLMTAVDSIKCRCVNSGMTGQVGGFQNRRVCLDLSASVSFLSSPPPPRSLTCTIFRAVFDSCSSFFAPKPHRNACYACYIPRHFQRLVTGKLTGVDPGRPQNLQRRKVEVTS